MKAWVGDIAAHVQCPPDFVAIAAVTVIGSVLGRKNVRDINRSELEAYAAELKMHPQGRELTDDRLRVNIMAFLQEPCENASGP